jgi:hypothetical protein
VDEFENALSSSGLGTPKYYDLYSPDGSLKPELEAFVTECLATTSDPAIPMNVGEQ